MRYLKGNSMKFSRGLAMCVILPIVFMLNAVLVKLFGGEMNSFEVNLFFAFIFVWVNDDE